MLFENIRLAFQALRQNKVRSILTMLGIIIAVWAVVLVVSIGEGIKGQVASEIGDIGSRLITINPGQVVTRDDSGEITGVDLSSSFTASTLTLDDLKDVKNNKDIEVATPQMLVSGEVKVGKKKVVGGLIGAVNEDYPSALNQKVKYGSFFSGNEENAQVVVVGSKIKEEYFKKQNPIGSTLSIRGEKYVIKGVMEEFDTGGINFGPDVNKAIFITLDVAKEFNNGVVSIQEIDAKVKEKADVDKVITKLTKDLKKNRGGEDNFTIIKQEELLAVTDSIFTILTSGVGLIASISIVVGGIGIMNIMLVSVTERTSEIGLRKAIGAQHNQILQQFLIEAVVLSVTGGIIGLGLAWISGYIVGVTTDLSPSISLIVIIYTLIGSAVIGVASGMWPAIKAARKNAIDALRHE